MPTDKTISHERLQADVVFHVHDVTKIYQMGEVQVHALRGVDLELYRGEFTVLLSEVENPRYVEHSYGLDTPTGGHVLYGDRDLNSRY